MSHLLHIPMSQSTFRGVVTIILYGLPSSPSSQSIESLYLLVPLAVPNELNVLSSPSLLLFLSILLYQSVQCFS